MPGGHVQVAASIRLYLHGPPGRWQGRGLHRASFNILCGTELTVVQEGIPDVIPPDACHLGWQESLMQLANLVDPEIPHQ
jgi:hypothetical protein